MPRIVLKSHVRILTLQIFVPKIQHFREDNINFCPPHHKSSGGAILSPPRERLGGPWGGQKMTCPPQVGGGQCRTQLMPTAVSLYCRANIVAVACGDLHYGVEVEQGAAVRIPLRRAHVSCSGEEREGCESSEGTPCCGKKRRFPVFSGTAISQIAPNSSLMRQWCAARMFWWRRTTMNTPKTISSVMCVHPTRVTVGCSEEHRDDK